MHPFFPIVHVVKLEFALLALECGQCKIPLWYNMIYQGKRAADGIAMILMICLLFFPKFPHQYYKESREKPPQMLKLILTFLEGICIYLINMLSTAQHSIPIN